MNRLILVAAAGLFSTSAAASVVQVAQPAEVTLAPAVFISTPTTAGETREPKVLFQGFSSDDILMAFGMPVPSQAPGVAQIGLQTNEFLPSKRVRGQIRLAEQFKPQINFHFLPAFVKMKPGVRVGFDVRGDHVLSTYNAKENRWAKLGGGVGAIVSDEKKIMTFSAGVAQARSSYVAGRQIDWTLNDAAKADSRRSFVQLANMGYLSAGVAGRRGALEASVYAGPTLNSVETVSGKMKSRVETARKNPVLVDLRAEHRFADGTGALFIESEWANGAFLANSQSLLAKDAQALAANGVGDGTVEEKARTPFRSVTVGVTWSITQGVKDRKEKKELKKEKRKLETELRELQGKS